MIINNIASTQIVTYEFTATENGHDTFKSFHDGSGGTAKATDRSPRPPAASNRWDGHQPIRTIIAKGAALDAARHALLLGRLVMNCRCKQYSRAHTTMGSIARISVMAPGENCANRLLESAFEVIDRFGRMVDRYLPCSGVRRLMDGPVDEFVSIPNQLWHLLRTANDIAYKTDGVFDVAAAGSDGLAHWTDMDLSVRGEVRLRRRLGLSLGGLSKGFAVDLAIQALSEMGVSAGLVDIGGCIRSFGPRAWRIEFCPSRGVDAKSASPAVPIVLQNGAVAGLGSMFSPARLLDVATGTVSSTAEWEDMNLLVRAPTCAVADALAKLAALSPSTSTAQLAPFAAEAILLTTTGAEQLNYVS